MFAYLFGDPLGGADEPCGTAEGEYQALAEPAHHFSGLGVQAIGPARATWGRGTGVLAVLDGDHVDPVEHDRPHLQHEASAPQPHGDRAREHEPRVTEDERATRAGDAAEPD